MKSGPLGRTFTPPAPSWRFMYLKALHAEGIENVTQAVAAAEDAIFQRWQELSGKSGDIEEPFQLQEASGELLKIKTKKLGWPNPFSESERGA